MKKLICIAFSLLMVYCSGNAQRAKLPFTKNKTVVIAHRGDHTFHPENTIEAFASAIKAGADYVEVDLRTTKDGHLVMMHDASLKRMTGVDGNVKDFTFKQIKQLTIVSKDSGSKKAYRIPDFRSLLKLCKGRINIYLDFKDADVSKTFRMIKEEKMENQVVVYSGNEQNRRSWKTVAPHIPIITSIPKNISSVELQTWIASNQADLVDGISNGEQMILLQKAGIPVWMDERPDNNCKEHINVICSWQNALDIGAAGIQTDHPEALIRFLKSKNNR